MDIYSWIIQNKEIAKILFGLALSLICFFVVLKSHKFFRLSNHHGIRYFRNAFFFYGIAFIIRYLVGTPLLENVVVLRLGLTKLLFEFFMILAGFFLLYSLLWKRLEHQKHYSSSLLNINIVIFYILSFIISFLDSLWASYSLLFFSQIILFFLLACISYSKSLNNKQKGFLKFYFLAMVLGFLAWTLNGMAALIFQWNYMILISVYLLNILIFIIFLIGIIKITK